jgi:hypothetical protein
MSDQKREYEKEDAKDMIKLQVSILKETMKKAGYVFAILADHNDIDGSEICFIDRDLYLESEKVEGFKISLTDLNHDLL